MLSSFQHPRSCIFFSPEHVTLSSPWFYAAVPSCACAHTHTDEAAWDKHGLKPRRPSVGQKHTLLLKSLLYPQQTKKRLHLRTVPTIRPWPGPFLLPGPSSLPPAHTPTVFFERGAEGERGWLFMLTCVHAGSLCQTRPLYNRRAKRLTSSFWRGHPPIQGWMSAGVEAHLHLYVRVGSRLTPEGYFCSGWLGSLELSLRSAATQAETGYSARVWPRWTFPDRGGAHLIFSP